MTNIEDGTGHSGAHVVRLRKRPMKRDRWLAVSRQRVGFYKLTPSPEGAQAVSLGHYRAHAELVTPQEARAASDREWREREQRERDTAASVIPPPTSSAAMMCALLQIMDEREARRSDVRATGPGGLLLEVEARLSTLMMDAYVECDSAPEVHRAMVQAWGTVKTLGETLSQQRDAARRQFAKRREEDQ